MKWHSSQCFCCSRHTCCMQHTCDSLCRTPSKGTENPFELDYLGFYTIAFWLLEMKLKGEPFGQGLSLKLQSSKTYNISHNCRSFTLTIIWYKLNLWRSKFVSKTFSTSVTLMQARTSADDNSGCRVLVLVDCKGLAKDQSSTLLSPVWMKGWQPLLQKI